MSEKEGRTCLTCAKAKIKCDKAHGGKCGRCARLGMECQAQLRGRGRPPNSALPAAAASAKPAASAKAAKHSKVVALDREPRARAPKFKSAQLVEEAYDESEVDEEEYAADDDSFFQAAGSVAAHTAAAHQTGHNAAHNALRNTAGPLGAHGKAAQVAKTVAATAKAAPRPRSMLVEAVKAALREQHGACVGPKQEEAARAKCGVVCGWLLDVACAGDDEQMHDDVLNLAEFLELDDALLDAPFAPRPLLTAAQKAAVQIPNFVAALDGGGSAFLVHASVGGAAAFFCNDDMATHFVSAPECDAVFAAGGLCDPDAVMRRLVATRDRPAYVRAMAELLVKQTDLWSETSLLVHVNARSDCYQQGQEPAPPVLCLAQLRASFADPSSAQGGSSGVVFGTKFIPMPDSAYLPLQAKSPLLASLLQSAQHAAAAHAKPAPLQQPQWLSAHALEQHAAALAQQQALYELASLMRPQLFVLQPPAGPHAAWLPFAPPPRFDFSFGAATFGPPCAPPPDPLGAPCVTPDSAGAAAGASRPWPQAAAAAPVKRSAEQAPEGRREKRQSVPSSRYSADCFATAGVFEKMTLGRGSSSGSYSGDDESSSNNSSSSDDDDGGGAAPTAFLASRAGNLQCLALTSTERRNSDAQAELDCALQAVDVNPFDGPDLFALQGDLGASNGALADLLGEQSASPPLGGPVLAGSASLEDLPFAAMMGSLFA